MRKSVLIICLFLMCMVHCAFAQVTGMGDTSLTRRNVSQLQVENHVYTYVEQMPQLPSGGGNAGIVAAIQKATRYSALAFQNKIEGRVIVGFTVSAEGEVLDAKILQGLGLGLDEEVLRSVKTLPRFIPGKQKGQAVSVNFAVPITFKMQLGGSAAKSKEKPYELNPTAPATIKSAKRITKD